MCVHVYAIAKQPAQIYTFWTGINTATSAHTWVLAAVAIDLPGLQHWASQGQRVSPGTPGNVSVCSGHWLLICRVYYGKRNAGYEAKQNSLMIPKGFYQLGFWMALLERGSFSERYCRYEPEWWRRAERPAKRERKQGQPGLPKNIAQDSAACSSFGQDLLPPSPSGERQSLIKRIKISSYSRHLSSTTTPKQEPPGTGGWAKAEVAQICIQT